MAKTTNMKAAFEACDQAISQKQYDPREIEQIIDSLIDQCEYFKSQDESYDSELVISKLEEIRDYIKTFQ